MPNQCSACGHPLNTLDDLVHHRSPNATPEELEIAKQHVRSFLRAATRQFGDLPLPMDPSTTMAKKDAELIQRHTLAQHERSCLDKSMRTLDPINP